MQGIQGCLRNLFCRLAHVPCNLRRAAAGSSWPQDAAKTPDPWTSRRSSYKIQSQSERIEMTVHSSRILTMEQKITQAQVNNPEVLELTPLSPNQIQVVGQVRRRDPDQFWGEDKKLYTVDVMVFGDVKQLEMVLRSTFPNAALKVTPVAKSVLISGFIDKPEKHQSHHPHRRGVLSEGHQQHFRRRLPAGAVAREDHGSFADQAPPVGLRFLENHRQNVITSGASGLLSQRRLRTRVAAGHSAGSRPNAARNGRRQLSRSASSTAAAPFSAC